MLSELCNRDHCLGVQETHRSSDFARPNIADMTPVDKSPPNKYGTTVFF